MACWACRAAFDSRRECVCAPPGRRRLFAFCSSSGAPAEPQPRRFSRRRSRIAPMPLFHHQANVLFFAGGIAVGALSLLSFHSLRDPHQARPAPPLYTAQDGAASAPQPAAETRHFRNSSTPNHLHKLFEEFGFPGTAAPAPRRLCSERRPAAHAASCVFAACRATA